MLTVIATDVPGDGTCMFHAIGLPLKMNGNELRKVAMKYISDNPDKPLHGQTIRQWIEWDSECTIDEYLTKMKRGWGGALDMTVISTLLKTPIFVYSPVSGGLCKRIAEVRPDLTHSNFESALSSICVLYVGRSHYMSLKISSS